MSSCVQNTNARASNWQRERWSFLSAKYAIRAQSWVLKKWYGRSVAEQVTLIDLYNQHASGQLDNSEAIPANFSTSRVACSLGRNKREMVMVSPGVAVGEMVSTLGRFVNFGIEEQERAASVHHSVMQSSTNFLYLNVFLESGWSPMATDKL